jgi:hypothetical protein
MKVNIQDIIVYLLEEPLGQEKKKNKKRKWEIIGFRVQ